MEKQLIMNDLYDLYGAFLTEKQQEIFELYFEEDLSFGEIAERMEISRQAVHDNLKRSEKILKQTENQLHLHERDEKTKALTAKIRTLLTEEAVPSKDTLSKIQSYLDLIDEM